MSPERYLAALASSLDTLTSLARQSDDVLSRSVPACPLWSLDQLFGHLGSIERWAAAVVLGGKYVEEPAPPALDASSWFLDGTGRSSRQWRHLTRRHRAGTSDRRRARRVSGFAVRRTNTPSTSSTPARLPAGRRLTWERTSCSTASTRSWPCLPRGSCGSGGCSSRRRPCHSTCPGPAAGRWVRDPLRHLVTAHLPEMYLGLWGRSNLEDTAVIGGDVSLALRVLRGPLTP